MLMRLEGEITKQIWINVKPVKNASHRVLETLPGHGKPARGSEGIPSQFVLGEQGSVGDATRFNVSQRH
jgi:hypothetical protein